MAGLSAAAVPIETQGGAQVQGSETPVAAVSGRADIRFIDQGDGTRLQTLYQHNPMRILFPQAAVGDLPLAAIVNTAGGFVGGDQVAIAAHVGARCRALVTQQAAEKIYRSTGAVTTIDVNLLAAPGSWLEWLPQETIVFDQACLRRRTCINVTGNGQVLAGEILVFGRAAMAEVFRHGLLREVWEIRRAKRLVWLDALHLEGAMTALMASAAGFAGAGATATAVYVGEDADGLLEKVRDFLPAGDHVRSAATVVNGILVIRWLAPRAQDLRREFGVFWTRFRAEVADLPGRLPRLWHI